MNTWTRALVVGAALLAGCNGKIGSEHGSTGSATGAGNSTGVSTGNGGAGVSITGAGGSVGITPPLPTVCTPGVPATTQLPRLTRVQYDNTTRELLGITSTPSTMLAPDTTGAMDQRAWDGFQAAADALAAEVMANATLKNQVLGCTTANDACARTFIETFGRRAFRRPLTAAETTRFNNLYTNRMTLTQGGTFDQAAQMILKAFLTSPSFITKAELSEAAPSGSNYSLNGYEMATRLSYMLWNSMPDEPLFTAAAANQLSTPDQLKAQATRMLMDPKARAKVAEFHGRFMLMGEEGKWPVITRNAAAYPNFTPAMVPMVAEETRRFLDYIAFDKGNGTFQDLLTSPVAFVNATLAPLYGLPAGSYNTNYTQVTLDASTPRPGVLTRVGFLMSHGLADRPSPILRGAFIQKEVLCAEIGMPDNAVLSTPLPQTGNTNRERVTAQTAPAACADCHHTVINPTGFTLENFDAMGVWRTMEGTAQIDATANVVMDGASVAVSGPADLMTKLANSPSAQKCYAQKWVAYAYERAPNSQDLCTAQSLATKIAQPSYSIVNLITDLTQSDSFRIRAKEL